MRREQPRARNGIFGVKQREIGDKKLRRKIPDYRGRPHNLQVWQIFHPLIDVQATLSDCQRLLQRRGKISTNKTLARRLSTKSHCGS